ncbi:MAG: zonular occludens toxin domain-containing protein [Burkholderiales bacterium]
MIIFITGAPGLGKTADGLKQLYEHEYYLAAEKTILETNIDKRDIKSVVVVGVRDYEGIGEYYPDTLPDLQVLERPQTVFFIDESGQYWPSRAAGKPKPAVVAHLAVHRHIGQDWIMTAQAPGQVDVEIRRLVGKHVHLLRTNLAVRRFEAGECRNDLRFTTDETYNRGALDKRVFDTYSSTDVRTSIQEKRFRLPKKLVFVLGFIALLAVLAVYFFSKDKMFFHHEKLADSHVSGSANLPFMSTGKASQPPEKQGNLFSSVPNHYVLKPPNPQYPEIAKLPRLIGGCIKSSSRCVCYDRSAQRIDNIGTERCERVVTSRNELLVGYDSQQDQKSSGSDSNQSGSQNNDKLAGECQVFRDSSGALIGAPAACYQLPVTDKPPLKMATADVKS